jgi:hypothetical protein
MTATIDPTTIATHLREVTEEEIAFYREHGWVKLPGLITPEFAQTLKDTTLDWHERNQKRPIEWHSMVKSEVEPFRSLVFSERMGRNAQRLMDRRRLSGVDVGVRYRADGILCKYPDGDRGRVPYHQDSTEHGVDRAGEMQVWLALADCSCDMGTMRFLSGVHREGPLGSAIRQGDEDLLARYPRLTEHYPLTEPMSYAAGDATVHHGFMVHGSGGNFGTRTRVAYIFSYSPADIRCWNGKSGNWGTTRTEMNDVDNPTVYPRG